MQGLDIHSGAAQFHSFMEIEASNFLVSSLRMKSSLWVTIHCSIQINTDAEMFA